MRYSVLVICMVAVLGGCRVKRHDSSEAAWHAQRSDSLVAVQHAVRMYDKLVHTLSVDSSRMVVTRYDTAGRVRERVEYQADRRTRQGEHATQQLHTVDSVRAGQQQAWQARSSTERVSDVKGYPYAWVAYVLAGVGVAIALSVLRGYLSRLLRG